MAANDVRGESLFLHLIGRMGAGFSPDNLGLNILHPGVKARLIAPGESVTEILHACGNCFSGLFNPQPYQLMAALGIESPDDVDVLARKALVYKQQLHDIEVSGD